MKIVFMGTPEFALPALERLITRGGVAAVVTQPDKPKGRSGKPLPPPVRLLAERHNIPVYQFNKIRAEGVGTLKALAPDVIVTAAYGQILSQEILDIPQSGVLNIHASLLPKYRGAAPVQWALINGERETGVTVMRTALSVDSGDILLTKRLAVLSGENSGELLTRLSVLGAEAIIEALNLIESGNAVFFPQNDAEATHYPMLRKTDGEIDFSLPAEKIVNLIRGVNPWPVAYTYYGDTVLKVYAAETASAEDALRAAGRMAGEVIEASPRGILTACGGGAILLTEVQLPGGKRLKAADFLRGNRLPAGTLFMRQL